MNNIFLIGASGHGKVVLDIVQSVKQLNVSYFIDNNKDLHGRQFMNIPVPGGDELLGSDLLSGMPGLVCIGDNKIRRSIFDKAKQAGHDLITAIHPSVIIAQSVKTGDGVAVMAGAIVNPDAEIGDNTIINTAATVDHDCKIGSHVHVAPGCHICGHVEVGDGALIGAGSTVVPMIKIGKDAVIGAGATVIHDVGAGQTVVGSPARPVK